MCIVIDLNTVVSVFNPDDANHADFQPVQDWIIEGKGKIVYGGSKYLQELGKVRKYARLFIELRKKRKVVVIEERLVDAKERELSDQRQDRDFDDPHICAILIVSGCCLVCSKDERSYPFLKKNEWYPKGRDVPKIYSSARNADLLCDRNIAEICYPREKLSKAEKESLQS